MTLTWLVRAPATTTPAEATSAISAYLVDERELGRIAADADIDSLTLSLVGGGHLLFADRDPGPPAAAVVNKLVTAVIADAVQRRTVT